jgi:hypothetical protein
VALLSRRQLLFAGSLAAVTLRAADTFVRVSRRDPRYLELSDGSPYIPIGLNLIAPPGRDPEAGMRTYIGWLDKLAANGGNYARAWLSNAFWDVEHAHSGGYDGEKAKRIDTMLAAARERGIRIKLTLEHFRSIGGGPQAWADKPLHNVSNGGPATSIADFFDGEKSRAQFRAKLDWFAARFGSRPEVFGWELWNEVNAVRGGDYLGWTEAMLPELHKRFPRNLCLQSLGSFDSNNARSAYQRHTQMAGNDLAQVHRYLDLGASLDVCKGPVDVLAADTVRELQSWNPGKPILLAESGAVEPKHAGPFKLYAADKEGTLLHDILYAPFFAGAAGPGQIWHWDAYVDPNNLWWHFGRFAEMVKGIDPAAEQFRPSMIEHPRLRVYRLTGRRTTLLWCREMRSDWRSELERGEAPEGLKGEVLNLRGVRGSLRSFDPWSGQWTNLRSQNASVTLPEFRRSLVLRAG